ncbi:hypothetical protein EJ08DRAFT_591635 [Tothia fuscella]|uniref:Uncharacterized protein n=1 Tax=Tothia fuscella TaxID=1048955 RepID=A0A9P4TXI9_9PEZI|nr:hypothetical protein EJ08DRAFT_591635 [Tothia fuscella]
MSNFYYSAQHHSQHSNLHSTHQHQHGRSRRSTRASGAHGAANHQKQLRAMQLKKEAALESAIEMNFRREFEAARSFDLEDDELFCPFHLLTEDDLRSINSSGSDRSSLSSGSPEQSPLQHQLQPTSSFLLPPTTGNFQSASYQQSSPQTKLHQPMAQRTRRAIEIVDPSTRAVASTPPSVSVSPARQMQQYGRRWVQ